MASTGQLLVLNQAGGSVTLSVEGFSPVTLPAGSSIQLPVAAGEIDVRAGYRQFGREYRLLDTEADVYCERQTTLVLPPETTARFQVANQAGLPGTLFLNGRPLTDLTPGAIQVIEAPIGPAHLEMRTNGMLVSATDLQLRAFTEQRWSIERPVADLRVVNPFPIPVEVVNQQGNVQLIPAFGQTIYEDLPLGAVHLTARRVTDEYIDDATVALKPGNNSTWTIDAPATGLVQLDNSHFRSTTVSVDGRLNGLLQPDQDRRMLLPVGWHHLVVKDDRGIIIADQWVEVEAFDTEAMRFGRSYHEPAYASAGGHGDSCHMPSGRY